MKLLCTNRSKPSIAAEYATSDDFRKLLTDGMAGLARASSSSIVADAA